MKKQSLLTTVLLLCALVAGSGSVWAIDVKVGGVEFAASDVYKSSTYSDTEWEYDSWTLTYAANNGGKWAHVRCGGKSSVSPASSTIVSPQITSPITKVTITNEGINGNSTGYAISSITLEAFSDAGLTSKTSTTTLSGVTLPTFGTSSSPSSFDITPASTIAANSYIKISISWSTTNSKNGGLDITNIDVYNTVTSTPATITAAEYATFVSPYATNFSTTGITVYTATDEETQVTLNEVASGQIPANTPVVLYKAGADGTPIDVPVIASASALGGTNDLRVSTGTDVAYMYVLSKKNSKVGFREWNGASDLSAGKVYLQGKAVYAREFIEIGEETTGVNEVKGRKADVAGEYYNIAGQRVAQPTKGLYIVNGKKVIVK